MNGQNIRIRLKAFARACTSIARAAACLAVLLAAAVISGAPAMAAKQSALELGGPKEHAEYVVKQAMPDSLFTVMTQSLVPSLAVGLRGDLATKGVTISSRASEAIIEYFMQWFVPQIAEEVRRVAIRLYRREFTDAQLAELAAFMRSSTGRAFVAKSSLIAQEAGFLGKAAGEKIGDRLFPRILAKIRDKDGAMFADPGVRREVMEYFNR